MPLHTLLSSHSDELLQRWAQANASDSASQVTRVELIDRMPHFIDELITALHPSALPLPDAASPSAGEHGQQRLRLGFDVGEVVREYGKLHLTILQLAAENQVLIAVEESQILTAAINRGTSDAVTEYVSQRDAELQRQSAEHLGFIAHELRNPLGTAKIAYTVLRGKYPIDEVRSAILLERSLSRLGTMIDNALAHARLKVGAPARGEQVRLADLVNEVADDAAIEAEAKEIETHVNVEPVTLRADPRLLGSAISNLVHNAIKFSHPGTTVAIRGWQHQDRIIIEVEDGCGGLPPGKTEELFSPFVQKSADRTGFGLGLAIARQAAESHNGTIKVRNVTGKGCVFTIDLPAVPA
jgi:signal transduction histidine kinase